MRQSYRRRPQDFKRRILSKIYTNRTDLYEEEHHWLSMIKENELGKRYYNLRNWHFDHWTNLSETKKLSIRERIAKQTKEAMARPEIREKYLNGLKEREIVGLRPDVKSKKSASMMGKNKGRVMEGESLENIRKATKTRTINKEALSRGGTSACNIMNSRKVICYKCGFEGNPGNIGRYHNEKCKN